MLNSTTGVISGTPTAAATQAFYTITASNSGGSATFSLSLSIKAALAINSVSNASPQALTAVNISTAGLDPTIAFTVTLTSASGTGSVNLTPIRTQADGTIVVAMPICLDSATGTTQAFSGLLTITQGGVTTAGVAINVADLPQLADFGTTLGAISRAFYIHQALSAAGNLNAQQALAQLPNVKLTASDIQTNLTTQLRNAILARNDVDRIITDPATSIVAGTSSDGTAVAFTAHSLELQDRIIGQYLLASTNGGTMVPATVHRTLRAHAALQRSAVAKSVSIPPGLLNAINAGISAAGSWATFKTGQQTLAKSDSSTLDNILATASEYQAIAVIGTTAVALGAAAVGAPAVAALAGAALTYEAIAGLMIGAASIGNDLYNVAVSGYAAYEKSGNDAAANSAFQSAGAALAADVVGTALSGFGVKAFAANAGVGTVAQSVFEGLWGDVSATDLTLGAAGLMTSTANIYIQNQIAADSKAAEDGLTQIETLTPGPQTGFGTVDTTTLVTNSQGSILSGLTSVQISDGTVAFQNIADETGACDVLIPLGNPSINYSNMTITAYDFISGLTLGSTLTDLSGLTSTTADVAQPVTGVCNDTDASAPDADDPDCD